MQIVDNRTWIIRAIIFNYQIDPPFRRNKLASIEKKKGKKNAGEMKFVGQLWGTMIKTELNAKTGVEEFWNGFQRVYRYSY